MTVAMFFTLLLIGLFGSFVSGMVGIGGSIVKYPLLLYIPPLLGLTGFSAHEVSGISAVQVLFATASGVWAYRKGGYLHKELILDMGVPIVFGSFIGAYGAKFLTEASVNFVYAILASIAALMMFFPKAHLAERKIESIHYNRVLAIVVAGIVGLLSGIVGAAGAFLLVPILLVVMRIPTRITIASSLAITFISSIGATVGKLWAGDVLVGPALVMIWASIAAAPIGAQFGKKVSVLWLQNILAVLILVTCIKIWYDILMN